MGKSKRETLLKNMLKLKSPEKEPLEIARKQWEDEVRNLPLPAGITEVPFSLGSARGLSLGPAEGASGSVLYFHGGGYVLGSSVTHRKQAADMAKETGWEFLVLDYPLAPEQPFPQAVEYGLHAYRELLTLSGQKSEALAFGGDSAGGGLALAVCLAAQKEGLPLPGRLFLISPWADLTLTANSLIERESRDPMVSLENLKVERKRYLQNQEEYDGSLVSPALAELKNLPPVMVLVGTEEALYDDARRIVDSIQNEGGEAVFHEGQGLWHVWPAWYDSLEEARTAVRSISQFLNS